MNMKHNESIGGKESAYFRETNYSGVYLIYSRNNLEAGFRNSLGYLGDAPRELGS
jgi:hypothetical protein